jgi:hypothetical protein
MRSKHVSTGIGVAVAAFLLVTNPVVSDAANQITGKSIKDSSVTGKDIKDQSLLVGDFKAGQLPGSVGPQGATGPQGAPGAPGPSGTSGYQVVQSVVLTNPAGVQSSGSASCPAGKVPVGGGVFGHGGLTQNVNASYPQVTGWRAFVNNSGSSSDTFIVYAICMGAP